MKDFFITFGHSQPGFPGYVRVTADTEIKARETMIKKYGVRWCNSYTDAKGIHPLDNIERDHLIQGQEQGNDQR